MKYVTALGGCAIFAFLLASSPCLADTWKPGVSVVSDRTFRGVSQTDGKPGVEGEVLWEPSAGDSLGVWAATLDYPGADNHVELDYFATIGTKLGGTNVSGGYIYRHRPGSAPLSYGEILAAVSHKIGPVSLRGSAYFSPHYFLGGTSTYLSLGGAAPIGKVLDLPLRVDAEIGRSSFSRPIGNYVDVKLRLLTRFRGLGLAASATTADLPRASRLPGRDHAGTRFAFTVLKMF